jgi:hypothetical protein
MAAHICNVVTSFKAFAQGLPKPRCPQMPLDAGVRRARERAMIASRPAPLALVRWLMVVAAMIVAIVVVGASPG